MSNTLREEWLEVCDERDKLKDCGTSPRCGACVACFKAALDVELQTNTRLHLAESHAGCDLLACDVKRELTGLAHGVATLKDENTRLLAAWRALDCDCETPGTVKCREAIRDGFQRQLREENTRLTEELKEADQRLASQTHYATQERTLNEALKAANTPLLARVAALEKLLSGNGSTCAAQERLAQIEDVLTDCGYTDEQARVAAVGILEKPSGTVPAVTGTTSDKNPFCNPVLEHVFKPAPFYPEQCDVKLDDHGRPRTCARPRSEHHG